MPISHTALILTMLCAPSVGFAAQAASAPLVQAPAQTQSQPAPQPQAQTQDAPAKPTGPSGLLQPSLDMLQQTLGALKLEKWKGGTVRDEARVNIASIMRDLQSTLPPLLAEADQASGTLSKVMPVSRNIDALYDVLMRVVDGSRVAAPSEQVTQLLQVMTNLEKARHALDDLLQDTAVSQEKQISDLRVALKTQPVPVCPVAAPPPAPAPAPKKAAPKKKRKPATAPQPSNTPPAAAAKPNQ